MKEEQLVDLFKCEKEDLGVLDNCRMSLRDLSTRHIQKHGRMPTLNDLIEEIFLEGIDIIYQAYKERRRKIYENKLKGNSTSKEEERALAKLSFPKDFRFIANYKNSKIYLIYNTNIYHTYFQKELNKAEVYMGFCFEEGEKINHAF